MLVHEREILGHEHDSMTQVVTEVFRKSITFHLHRTCTVFKLNPCHELYSQSATPFAYHKDHVNAKLLVSDSV